MDEMDDNFVPDIESDAAALERSERHCKRVNDRLDVAVSAYLWAKGKDPRSAFIWYKQITLTREEYSAIYRRVQELSAVANGHGVADAHARDAGDAAALAVLNALPLKVQDR